MSSSTPLDTDDVRSLAESDNPAAPIARAVLAAGLTDEASEAEQHHATSMAD